MTYVSMKTIIFKKERGNTERQGKIKERGLRGDVSALVLIPLFFFIRSLLFNFQGNRFISCFQRRQQMYRGIWKYVPSSAASHSDEHYCQVTESSA